MNLFKAFNQKSKKMKKIHSSEKKKKSKLPELVNDPENGIYVTRISINRSTNYSNNPVDNLTRALKNARKTLARR